MKIIDIKENGCNNILTWALTNKANIKEDRPLLSLINDETFYMVTLGGINFLELFRLTQLYREKLRICKEHQASMPSEKELLDSFPGTYTDSNNENSIKLEDIVKHVITTFENITKQMRTDDDIINSNAARLFLPMITRKFDVQIPVSFADFVDSMNDEEISKMFSDGYPGTLNDIIDNDVHGVKTTLSMGFVKCTSILKHDPRYDKYLKAIKYYPLKTYQKQRLYKVGLVSFFKRDPIARTEVRYSLFKQNANNSSNILKRISRLNPNSYLSLEFAIQLPIQYMQMLLNAYSREILNIAYESSMSNIVDNGLIYNDFKTSDHLDEEQMTLVNNNIETYKTRITEANQILLNSIPIILSKPDDVDVTNTFALLPSIYMSTAVIKVDYDTTNRKIVNIEPPDPLLEEMFGEITNICHMVQNDIRKTNYNS